MAPPSIIEKYERILQADPRSRIFVELARALLDDGAAERAAEACRTGLGHHPDSIQARIIWGKALLALGQQEEALARFEEAIATDPLNPYAYDLAGEALVAHGQGHRAIPFLKSGAALLPGDRRIRRWLAEAERTVSESESETGTAAAAASATPPATSTATETASSAANQVGTSSAPGIPAAKEPPAASLPAGGAASANGAEAARPSPSRAEAGPEADGCGASVAPATCATAAEVPEPAAAAGGAPEAPPPLRSPQPPPLLRAGRAERPATTPTARVLSLLPDSPGSGPASSAAAEPEPPATAGGMHPMAVTVIADEESEAEAAARSYEYELREKLLAEPAASHGFLRRHARAVSLTALALAALAGLAVFMGVRNQRRAGDARAAVQAARKGLARDTAGALREASRVLDGALRTLPDDAEANALAAEISALQAHDYGDARAQARARDLLASGRAGAGAVAARWLVAAPDEERAAAQALLDSAPDGTPLARALAGELLLSRRDLEGARLQLDAAARASPPLLRALVGLGDLDLARGDVEAALGRYVLALRAHPTHPRAALGAAEARLRLDRDLPEALRALEAVNADPGSVAPRKDALRMDLVMARLLAAGGRSADAEKRLADAARRDPNQPLVAVAQAEVRARAGDIDGALRAAERAVRLAPEEASRELLARLQLRRGRYRELLSTSDAAATRTLRLYRGIAALELGDPQRARTELEGTRRDGKMTAEAASWTALAELAAGRRRQASALISALLAAPSPHPVALLARARLALAERQPDAAERNLRASVERDPDLVDARLDLGRLLLEQHRAAEARDVLEKAVARNPFHLEARRELARARLATGDAVGAAGEFDRVVAERPDEAATWIALSSARLAAGSAGEARRAAERALSLSPRSASAALAAGKAAAAQGEVRDAQRLLELAARLGGRAPEGAEARRALAALKRR